MKKLGWIGLGNMGTPMALNLEKAGFPLCVYNRNADKSASFKNTKATIANNIQEIVQNSDIIFTMVSNDDAVKSVYDEIFKTGSLEGKIFIDMSTISLQLSEATAVKLKEAKASFLDAPVAGSTKPAAGGTLIVMVGGEEDVLQTAKPYLEKLGKSVKHLGANGQGIAAKLSVNYFVASIYQALSEAVLTAEKNGVKRADILEIINESPVGSGATKLKTPLLVKDEYPTQFALELMLKDILLAKEIGSNYPFAKAMIDTYSNAKNEGLGKEDVIALIKYLKDSEK